MKKFFGYFELEYCYYVMITGNKKDGYYIHHLDDEGNFEPKYELTDDWEEYVKIQELQEITEKDFVDYKQSRYEDEIEIEENCIKSATKNIKYIKDDYKEFTEFMERME